MSQLELEVFYAHKTNNVIPSRIGIKINLLFKNVLLIYKLLHTYVYMWHIKHHLSTIYLFCVNYFLSHLIVIFIISSFQTLWWWREKYMGVWLMVRIHFRCGSFEHLAVGLHRHDRLLDHLLSARLQSRGSRQAIQLPSNFDDFRLRHSRWLL